MRANASAGPADDRYPTLAGVRLYPRLALHRLRRHFRLRPHDVDAPLEIRPILDADPTAFDVADQPPLFPYRDLLRHLDIAVDAPEDRDLARLDVPPHLSVRSHRQQALRFQQ